MCYGPFLSCWSDFIDIWSFAIDKMWSLRIVCISAYKGFVFLGQKFVLLILHCRICISFASKFRSEKFSYISFSPCIKRFDVSIICGGFVLMLNSSVQSSSLRVMLRKLYYFNGRGFVVIINLLCRLWLWHHLAINGLWFFFFLTWFLYFSVLPLCSDVLVQNLGLYDTMRFRITNVITVIFYDQCNFQLIKIMKFSNLSYLE